MFRPHLAKMIVAKYGAKVVLDPCCGWGGRMLGTVAAGAKYIGFEPNTETYKHLIELAQYLNISDQVQIYNEGAENISNYNICCDLVLTSPPYYNTEIYCKEETQSITNYKTYEEWRDNWLKPVIVASVNCLNEGGVSCWNVAPNMINDVAAIHNALGYEYNDVFGLHSSARQANQNIAHDKKTVDATVCYKKL
jgi:tRNA1(Val) A37 N6-methylase TrmN6